ncbi:MAG: helix-turn-helix domain-containing protein, partial [Planctomycetaceae bacterium]|nr:helix-turn-helix domain-containing protein [Planctomycetaceae bacterium]
MKLKKQYQKIKGERHANRVLVVLAFAEGFRPSQFAQIFLLDADTIRRYFCLYKEGGMNGLLEMRYGRNNCVVSSDGTITRTVYDWRGNVKQTWIGTNDTGATNTNPHPNNQSANNMLIVSETEYGGGAGCSTCMAAKDRPRVAIQYVDANTMRITEFGYDWRGRQTHVHNENDEDGNMTYTVQTYDNMNRVVKSERFLLVLNDSYDGGSSGSYSSNGSSSGMYFNSPMDMY